jgi:hypothetical protein
MLAVEVKGELPVHAMKAYRGNGGVASLINFNTGWR